MKQKKIPMRMCVVTHERCEKRDLIRIVKTPEGIIVDPTGKVNGRGFYLKKDINVIDLAQKNKILNNLFGETITDEIYNNARAVCSNEK